MRAADEALGLVESFSAAPEEEKSRELILALLEQTPEPFSRRQFHPGHITCTALVFDPGGQHILLVYHHRLRRWLLPGGHVEEPDVSLSDAARREAIEETSVSIAPGATSRLAGMDVHAIPAHPGKKEPFHLHHDLIFSFFSESDVIARSQEAPEVAWCSIDALARYQAPPSIVRPVLRLSEFRHKTENR